jgi:hypothetical protein
MRLDFSIMRLLAVCVFSISIYCEKLFKGEIVLSKKYQTGMGLIRAITFLSGAELLKGKTESFMMRFIVLQEIHLVIVYRNK